MPDGSKHGKKEYFSANLPLAKGGGNLHENDIVSSRLADVPPASSAPGNSRHWPGGGDAAGVLTVYRI
jgi:hypothetical protein